MNNQNKKTAPKFLGVCATIADMSGANVSAVRWLVFILGLFLFKEILIAYLVAAIAFSIMKNNPNNSRTTTQVHEQPKKKKRDNKDTHNYMDF